MIDAVSASPRRQILCRPNSPRRGACRRAGQQCEGRAGASDIAEAWGLGLGEPFAISAVRRGRRPARYLSAPSSGGRCAGRPLAADDDTGDDEVVHRLMKMAIRSMSGRMK